MKRIVSACIDEILSFDNAQESEDFLRRLEYSPRKHRVVSVSHQEDGCVLMHVMRQYNNAPLHDKEER